MTPCPRCHRNTTDGLLCTTCGNDCLQALATIATLTPELRTTVTRQDRIAHATLHRPQEPDTGHTRRSGLELAAHPLPVSFAAAATADRLSRRFRDWTATLWPAIADLPAPVLVPRLAPNGPTCDRCTHRSCRWIRGEVDGPWCLDGAQCRHPGCWAARAHRNAHTARLAGVLPELRRHPAGARLVGEVVKAAQDLARTVDRRAPEMFAGTCDAPAVRLNEGTVTVDLQRVCGADLYARLGEDRIVCPRCRATHSYADRVEIMRESVRDVWARPALIAQALVGYGYEELTPARLDVWITRDRKRHEQRCWPGVACGHLLPVCLDSELMDENGGSLGRPLYRVGDVMERAEAARVERERQGRRAG